MKILKKAGILAVIMLTLIAFLLPAVPAAATHDGVGVPYAVGDVFAGIGGGQVAHYAPDGTLKHILDSGLGAGETTGMAFDTSGNLYVTFFTANRIAKFDNVGNLIAVLPYVFASHPESISFNAAGEYYVGVADGNTDIHKFDAADNYLTQYNAATESRGTDWIDLAADQNTIFYTSEGYQVKRYDVSTNTQLPDFATLSSRPSFALRIRTNGEVLVASSSQVVRLNADGSVNQTYPKPATENSFLFALNLDPDGTSFWTAGYSSGNIYKIDIATGSVLTQFTASINPTLAGLAIFGEPTVGRPEDQVDVFKDWRYTNVCFERDDDNDGLVSEDPVEDLDGDGIPDMIDNDGDGLIDEDGVDCPDGSYLGDMLPQNEDGVYQLEAVVKKNGKVSSYNPGQFYAVSTVNLTADVDQLVITENYSAVTPDIGVLNPANGGGKVVVVTMVDGEWTQILDANDPEVVVDEDSAIITLLDPEPGTYIVYVKFAPGMKGEDFQNIAALNINSAEITLPDGNVIGDDAIAAIEVHD